jgi:hypothetical protein
VNLFRIAAERRGRGFSRAHPECAIRHGESGAGRDRDGPQRRHPAL